MFGWLVVIYINNMYARARQQGVIQIVASRYVCEKRSATIENRRTQIHPGSIYYLISNEKWYLCTEIQHYKLWIALI